MGKSTKEQLLDTVESSSSGRGGGSKRFDRVSVGGIDFIRANYGHTFDVSQGKSLAGEDERKSLAEENSGTTFLMLLFTGL